MGNYEFNKYDLEAINILNDFLPDNIFDAHMHLSLHTFAPGVSGGRHCDSTYDSYINDMMLFLGPNRKISINIITEPDDMYKLENKNAIQLADEFLVDNLQQHKNTVGEIIVMPNETIDSIEKRIKHNRIIGFKCYHSLMDKQDTWNANIGDYLPESAWEYANDNNMCITLHMVKNKALSDKDNMDYIKTMSNKYKNARLILAHAGRSFASWTGIEAVCELIHHDNVFFDLSAVCESPAIFQIIRKIGSSRCMWGSDYSCNMLVGKAISIADSFYWIYDRDIENFKGNTEFHSWLIGTENLMAVRQACILAETNNHEVENIFFNTAHNLFMPKQ